MIGRRLPDGEIIPSRVEPGDYVRSERGAWYCRPPGFPGLGSLANHSVTEHEDGTITVSPSILITWSRSDGERSWHGYLERGVWREV